MLEYCKENSNFCVITSEVPGIWVNAQFTEREREGKRLHFITLAQK